MKKNSLDAKCYLEKQKHKQKEKKYIYAVQDIKIYFILVAFYDLPHLVQ